MVVARDIAHAKIKDRLDAGEPMPDYLRDHCVYYAGPAKTPDGYASGSFGPTTAGRMDAYVDQFQAAGGSLVMLAKGNRSKQVTDACQRHGGFYLGSIGGPAARLAQDCITKVEVLEYPELGMEAVWRIEVARLPGLHRRRRQGQGLLRRLLPPGGAGREALTAAATPDLSRGCALSSRKAAKTGASVTENTELRWDGSRRTITPPSMRIADREVGAHRLVEVERQHVVVLLGDRPGRSVRAASAPSDATNRHSSR